jgi:hypothetical protein
MILTKYGPVYLSSEEYEKRLAQKIQSYYEFLGRSVFQRRGKEFWDYHREGLKNLGFPLNWGTLIKASAKELYSRLITCLLHPRTTARSVIGLVKRDRDIRQRVSLHYESSHTG